MQYTGKHATVFIRFEDENAAERVAEFHANTIFRVGRTEGRVYKIMSANRARLAPMSHEEYRAL